MKNPDSSMEQAIRPTDYPDREMVQPSSIFTLAVFRFAVWIMLFVALLNDLPGFISLSVSILLLVYGARLWSRLSAKNLAWTSKADRFRLFPGERVHIEVGVENRKILPILVQVALSAGDGLVSDAEQPLSMEARLPGYRHVHLRWDFTAQKRGWYPMGASNISCSDLFGFFQSKATGNFERVHIAVFPKLVPVAPPRIMEMELFGAPGSRVPAEDPVYFAGTRDYQYARPARRIYWKGCARYGRLQEKVFEPSAQKKVLLLLDVGPFHEHGATDDFERMMEAIGSLAVHFHALSCPVGLVTNGLLAGGGVGIFPLSRKPERITEILDALARVRMKSQAPIADLLANIRLPLGTGCIHAVLKKKESATATADYFSRRKLSLVTLVCEDDGPEARQIPRTYFLSDILVDNRIPMQGGMR